VCTLFTLFFIKHVENDIENVLTANKNSCISPKRYLHDLAKAECIEGKISFLWVYYIQSLSPPPAIIIFAAGKHYLFRIQTFVSLQYCTLCGRLVISQYS